jgi:predicted alpha/beta superfamily hydrolase
LQYAKDIEGFKMLNRIFTWLVFINLCGSSLAYAEIRVPSKEVITSRILAEDREIRIQLPTHYDVNIEQEYPVLYLLDGPSNLSHTSGTLDFLVGYAQAPQLIIVAITHKQRSLDLTPTYNSDKEFPNGGGEKFLNFLEQELMPHINNNYRAQSFNLIAGHSLGGLLVLHSMATRPHLFQAHFSFSPSLYWDDKVVLKNAKKFLSTAKQFNNFLYINMGNEGIERGDDNGMAMRNGVIELTSILDAYSPDGFHFRADVFEQENHQTTPIIGQFHAFRSLYPNWELPWRSFESGLTKIKEHYDMLTSRYGYQIKPFQYQVNDAGYFQLLNKGNVEEAVKLFEFNVKNFPECANCYDSLADGYEKQGKLKEALALLDKALTYSHTSKAEVKMITNHQLRINKLINQSAE